MATRDARMADKALNKQHTAILTGLLAAPGNKFCADCHRKDPRWASWNLGVWVCIRCSGIHRSIGTHISKVKSVDLDCWRPDEVRSMERWGNQRANAYWEANVPSGRGPTDSNIETWIRSKYERKAFAAPGPIPEPETIGIAADGAGEEDGVDTTPRSVNGRGHATSTPTPVTQKAAPVQDMFDFFDSPPASSPTPTPAAVPTPTPAHVPAQASAGQNGMNSIFSSPPPSNQGGSSVFQATPTSKVPDIGGSSDALKSYIMSLYAKPQGGGNAGPTNGSNDSNGSNAFF